MGIPRAPAKPAGRSANAKRWSMEEKIRVARESFPTEETVASVARRYGISRYRLSSWRSLLRRGKLVASSGRGFAAIAVALVELR